MEQEPRKRVLLTGASGGIGRCISPTLAEHYELRSFDRQASDTNPDLIVGDLIDYDTLRAAMEGVHTLIHLAAQPYEADFVSVLVPNNVVGMYNTMEAARDAGVKRVIFASTIQAMGSHPHGVTITEADLPRPTSLYGATKALGETIGRWYHDRHGIEFLAVRIGWFLDPENPVNLNTLHEHRSARTLWLSPRDARQIFVRAVDVPKIGEDGYGIVHATSNTIFERLSLEPSRSLLGYEPIDDARVFEE